LKADFFSDTLTAMRHETMHEEWVRRHTKFVKQTDIRDQEAIIATTSGLLKILYPDLNVSFEEFNNFCLQPAVTMRQYIRNQLWLLDAEYRQTEKHLLAQPIQ
jgi:ATP-dependent Lon protease